MIKPICPWIQPIYSENYEQQKFLEIIFFRKLFLHNKFLWSLSYPFHIGVYLFILWSILHIISVHLMHLEIEAIFYAAVSLILFFGSLLLLYRLFTSLEESINLVIILSITTLGILAEGFLLFIFHLIIFSFLLFIFLTKLSHFLLFFGKVKKSFKVNFEKWNAPHIRYDR
ncbi:MAG: hypothetical protein NZ895_01600 [Archaeoglobaceae archaeon]|nr:hypothetical protein [Archaeoglobaceae archaeon]MCX8151622.1 hypothetical protein [Archaeoglobaceae archaeon]MDW8013100.1 hypothetical protein [Archaeoglobaceae archaeon]